MNGAQFDELAKAVAKPISRRSALRSLAVAALGGLGALLARGVSPAEAACGSAAGLPCCTSIHGAPSCFPPFVCSQGTLTCAQCGSGGYAGACGGTCPACSAPFTCISGACGCDSSRGLSPCPNTGIATSCVNVQTDASNCGACGHACGANTTCANGACVCPAGQTNCGGTCVTCPSGGVCSGTTCACPSGTVLKGSACVACGGAGQPCCTSGTACTSGSCSSNLCCPSGQTNCGGSCVACPTGGVCSGTTCGCPANTLLTNGACVGCGADGQTCCSSGTACVNNNCSSGICCPAGQTNCGGTCVACPTGGACTGTTCGCPAGTLLKGTSCICAHWTLASDFKVSPSQANPNPDTCGNAGTWSFLQSTTQTHDPATYSSLSNFLSSALGVSGLQEWSGDFILTSASDMLPAVGLNSTTSTQHPTTLSWPAGAIVVHPGPGQLVIVGWKSPITGTVSITGGVTDVDDNGGDGIGWSIDKGATTLAHGSIPPCGAQLFQNGINGSSLASVAVSQGDILYFAIDPLTNYLYDATRVDITITGLTAS